MQKTQWCSCTSSCQLRWLDNSRPQGPKRQLRVSKQSPICNRGAGLGHPMDPIVSVQNKNFSGLEPDRKPQVISTDNSLEFGKACEDLSWNHCTSTPHRSDHKWDCWKSSAQSKKKAPLPHCCNPVWVKTGGQIPWNAVPICETFKISYLMGRPHMMKDVLGNHLKDRSFRLVHWLSITLFLRKTSQESINLERKSFLDCSWIVPWIRFVREKNLEGWRIGCRPWGVGDDGRIRNLL